MSFICSGIKNVSREKVRHSLHKLIEANPDGDGYILCCIISGKDKCHILSWFVELCDAANAQLNEFEHKLQNNDEIHRVREQ